MYNKTELDKLRDDMKEQIVDPRIKKLEALINSFICDVAKFNCSCHRALSSFDKENCDVIKFICSFPEFGKENLNIYPIIHKSRKNKTRKLETPGTWGYTQNPVKHLR